MGVLEGVLVIIVLGMVLSAWKAWLRRIPTGADPRRVIELERRIAQLEQSLGKPDEQLEERVRVIEDIVTSKDYDLEERFRQLEQDTRQSSRAIEELDMPVRRKR